MQIRHNENCEDKDQTFCVPAHADTHFYRICKNCGGSRILNREDYLELNVTLFKPSGKWAHQFTVVVPNYSMSYATDNKKLLEEIDKWQKETCCGLVTSGEYHVVIAETANQMAAPNHRTLIARLILAKV